jgi:DNA-binding PadR family transcriptional regulator
LGPKEESKREARVAPEKAQHRHHKGGRRPKLGRFFAHGDLRFLILKLIAEKPRHGYELIKAIEDQVAGAYSPSPGVIYPTLTLLEELDWIQASASEGSKKRFEITPEGTLSLEANKTTVEAILTRMAEVTDAQAGDTALDTTIATGSATPQLKLALDDLKRTIENRLSGEPLTKDQADAIVAALASAAEEVERA